MWDILFEWIVTGREEKTTTKLTTKHQNRQRRTKNKAEAYFLPVLRKNPVQTSGGSDFCHSHSLGTTLVFSDQYLFTPIVRLHTHIQYI